MNKYDEIISTLGTDYLQGIATRLQVGGKFCLVDNIEDDEDLLQGSFSNGRRIIFPLKITRGFCLYCHSGMSTLRIQQRDYHIEKHGVLVVHAGQILEKVDIPSGTKLIFASLDSEYIMTGMRGPHGDNLKQLFFHHREPIITEVDEQDAQSYEHLCHSVKLILANCDSNTADGILSGFAYIFASLLFKWTRKKSGRTLKSGREEEILSKFEDDVHNFSRKDRTVAFYARRQYLSEKYFSRTVKKASGRTPVDIIRDYVILDAKSLLLTGLYSVKEVADKLGFDNYSFFSRYFRSSTGQTPSEYLRTDNK